MLGEMRVLQRISSTLLIVGVGWPSFVNALSFDPNQIITDEEMVTGLFSRTQTIAFLRTKAGYLGQQADVYGGLIYDAATENGLNPQFLLVQIQKESSLIEDPKPSPHQIEYALGFGCPDDGTCAPAYRGFHKQITKAAAIFKSYLADLAATGVTISGWRVGEPRRTGSRRHPETRDGQPVSVTPANAATAAMYTYNPWVGGHFQIINGRNTYIGANYNFRVIWERYFVAQRVYPDGTLLRGEGQAGIWLIKNGQRHPFVSRSAFLANYDPRKVITVPTSELEQYERGSSIRFANYSLVESPDGVVYLLADGFKRPFASPAVFRTIGFHPEEVIPVSGDELAPYPDGQPIHETTTSPIGKLVQLTNGGIAFVDGDNVRHPIYAKEILKSRWPRLKPERIGAAAFAALRSGPPVTFRDGELVTAPGAPAVYLISKGQKRPIASPQTFTAYRFRWRNVIRTSLAALAAHPDGEPLAFGNPG